MRSALRGGLPCPSRQPVPFRVADQVMVPSRTLPFGDHPVRVVSAEARPSTPLLLVTAPLAVSRIQLRVSMPDRNARRKHPTRQCHA